MTNTELTDEFEILFEDLATNGSKGLNNYEKSVCYTYAQEQIVKQLAVSGNYEPITSIVKVEKVAPIASTLYKTAKKVPKTVDMLHEIGYFASGVIKDIPGVAVPQAKIDSMLIMPYQYPPKDLVYVVVGEDAYEVFLPLNFTAPLFNTRYVEYPTPVILDTLTGSETINSLQDITAPVLSDDYHRTLVNTAVQYAVKVYIGQQEKEVKDGGK